MNKPIREGFVIEGEAVKLDDDEPKAAAQPAPVLEAPEEDKPSYEELEAEVKRLRARLSPPPDEWPLVIKLLHKPIKSDKEMVSELSFREPNANDMIKAGGNPVRASFVDIVNGNAVYDYVIDDLKMIKLMANLCGFHDAFLRAMDPRDFASAAYRLRRFFISEQGLW